MGALDIGTRDSGGHRRCDVPTTAFSHNYRSPALQAHPMSSPVQSRASRGLRFGCP